jgi:DNA primase|tara:strand:+ start:7059 stop:8045 length:987 start_codon:yes stop_codon:yes gene_type:complete
MNIVAPQFIRDYLLEKFKDNYKLSSGESELIVPSVFISDDWKRHMSINLDTGLWQCFKSGNKGNFIQIYAYLEGITYNKAEADIMFREFNNTLPVVPPAAPPKPSTSTKNLDLTDVTLESHTSSDPLIQKAWVFLYERKLFNLETGDSKYYIARNGAYRGRLIIPFEEDGHFFYFQARSLGDESPKYLNPSDEWVKPSHILYPYDEKAKSLVICEGPLDAISLQIQGVNATCTMGCSVSEHQVEILRNFEGKIIIGYDNDDAGKRGVSKFDYLRKLKRMADLYICHPPSEVKDWNEAHMKGFDLQRFINLRTEEYDYTYLMNHLLTTL